MFSNPTFIAFTGVDSADCLPGMMDLGRHYPIEWGVLVDDDKVDDILFANPDVRARLLETPGLLCAAHVCGEQARLIANSPQDVTVDLSRFQRAQVNHSFSGSSAEQIENTVRFGRMKRVRTMLQCLVDFPADCRLDWLYDTSFGTGKSPDRWPALPGAQGPLCGYSGGIRAENVRDILSDIAAPVGSQYFIDMESGVRTDGRFDLGKCEAVCKAVFG
jgi:hypothetical protein